MDFYHKELPECSGKCDTIEKMKKTLDKAEEMRYTIMVICCLIRGVLCFDGTFTVNICLNLKEEKIIW